MREAAYIRIHDEIKKEIEQKQLQFGERLASERELAENFSVSRATLRQAILKLSEEGLVEKRPGAGTFVVGSRVKEKMRGTTSFTEIVKSQGKQASSQIISYAEIAPSSLEQEKLALRSGEKIIKMERIRYADDIPICFEVTCIPSSTIAGSEDFSIQQHFFQTLIEKGYQIGRSQQTISSRIASSSLANHLKIRSGSSLLSLIQLSFFEDGTPFEYVSSVYVGERFEFYLER